MSGVGVIAPVRDTPTVLAAGADYVEPSIVGNVVVPAEGGWVPNPDYDAPPAPSFAVLFPGDVKLADPTFPMTQVEAYLGPTLDAVAQVALPGALVVLGSGAARTIPVGADRAAARARFAEVVMLARDLAAERDLRLVLEPLHTGETNLVNSVGEAVELLTEHRIDGVPVVADLFHIVMAGEPLEAVAEHTTRIGHVHLADTGRRAPGTGDWPIAELLTLLRARGYDGSLTIECHWDDLARELPDALAVVRDADRRAIAGAARA